MLSRHQNCCWCGQSGQAHPRGDRTMMDQGLALVITNSSRNSKLFMKASWFDLFRHTFGSCSRLMLLRICVFWYCNQTRGQGPRPRPKWTILFGLSHPCLITNWVIQPVLASKWYLTQLSRAVLQYGWESYFCRFGRSFTCLVAWMRYAQLVRWHSDHTLIICFRWPGCLVRIRIPSPSHCGPRYKPIRSTLPSPLSICSMWGSFDMIYKTQIVWASLRKRFNFFHCPVG